VFLHEVFELLNWRACLCLIVVVASAAGQVPALASRDLLLLMSVILFGILELSHGKIVPLGPVFRLQDGVHSVEDPATLRLIEGDSVLEELDRGGMCVAPEDRIFIQQLLLLLLFGESLRGIL
jgi:hypothetical protein